MTPRGHPAAASWRSHLLDGWRKRLPLILQSEAAECGLASLAMVACFHGHETGLADLRKRLSVSLKGMNLAQLIDAAHSLDLAGRPLRLELAELPALQTPCVLHWDQNHFVVLESARGKRLTIHDPAVGRRTMSLQEASPHFTGVALELTPTPDFEPCAQPNRLRLRRLFGRVQGAKPALAQVIAISLGIEFCALLGPLYVQWTVDHALLSADTDLLTLLALGFGLVALTQVGISALRSWLVLNLSTHFHVQWAVNVFSHLLRLPLPYFERRHLGDVVSRFDSIQAIQRTLTSAFVEGIIDGLMAVLMLTMMLMYSGWLTSIVVAAVALYALLRLIAYAPLRQATEEQIVLGARQQTTFLESVRGMQAIKLFGREAQRQWLWHNRLVDTTNRLLRTERMLIAYRLANGGLLATENILVVWVGAQLILGNVFSIGMLFAFVVYKNIFSARVSNLVDKAMDVRMLSLHAERLADIVLTERESRSTPAWRRDLPAPSLELQAVGFRYSEVDPPVLQAIDLTIPAGASVAIIGPSGCGKTTLAKILLGLLAPTQGHVLVGGTDLRHLGLATYRRLVNAVMQDDHLFAGTIADNICFFADRPDAARVENAARFACIHDDIVRMSMGYDTLVGDMGTALSGGQRQRVLLARALYAAPRILVLDEATSHLDVDLERAINRAVRALRITRIVIAHRRETIASCDLVIELPVINGIDATRRPAPTDDAGPCAVVATKAGHGSSTATLAMTESTP